MGINWRIVTLPPSGRWVAGGAGSQRRAVHELRPGRWRACHSSGRSASGQCRRRDPRGALRTIPGRRRGRPRPARPRVLLRHSLHRPISCARIHGQGGKSASSSVCYADIGIMRGFMGEGHVVAAGAVECLERRHLDIVRLLSVKGSRSAVADVGAEAVRG